MAKRVSKNDRVTIKTDEVMGEGSFVVFLRPDLMVKDQVAQQDMLEDAGVKFNIKGEMTGGEFTPSDMKRFGLESLSDALIEWDWVDFDGEPLPMPTPDDPENTQRIIVEHLRAEEVSFLSDKLRDLYQSPGKSKASNRSSKR